MLLLAQTHAGPCCSPPSSSRPQPSIMNTIYHRRTVLANYSCSVWITLLALSGDKREEMSSGSGRKRWDKGWMMLLKPTPYQWVQMNWWRETWSLFESCCVLYQRFPWCTPVWHYQGPHVWGRNDVLNLQLLHQPMHNGNSSHQLKKDTVCSHIIIPSTN